MKPLPGLPQKTTQPASKLSEARKQLESDVLSTGASHVLCWDGTWLKSVVSGNRKSASFPDSALSYVLFGFFSHELTLFQHSPIEMDLWAPVLRGLHADKGFHWPSGCGGPEQGAACCSFQRMSCGVQESEHDATHSLPARHVDRCLAHVSEEKASSQDAHSCLPSVTQGRPGLSQ